MGGNGAGTDDVAFDCCAYCACSSLCSRISCTCTPIAVIPILLRYAWVNSTGGHSAKSLSLAKPSVWTNFCSHCCTRDSSIPTRNSRAANQVVLVIGGTEKQEVVSFAVVAVAVTGAIEAGQRALEAKTGGSADCVDRICIKKTRNVRKNKKRKEAVVLRIKKRERELTCVCMLSDKCLSLFVVRQTQGCITRLEKENIDQ